MSHWFLKDSTSIHYCSFEPTIDCCPFSFASHFNYIKICKGVLRSLQNQSFKHPNIIYIKWMSWIKNYTLSPRQTIICLLVPLAERHFANIVFISFCLALACEVFIIFPSSSFTVDKYQDGRCLKITVGSKMV